MNNDAGNLSTYVYKELNGKMKMAVWDYNNCLDNYQWFAQDFIYNYTQQAAWFSRMLEDRNFVERLVSRYEEAIAQLKAAYARRTEYMDAHISDFYDECIN